LAAAVSRPRGGSGIMPPTVVPTPITKTGTFRSFAVLQCTGDVTGPGLAVRHHEKTPSGCRSCRTAARPSR
jgi:hypothetical protein